MKKHNILLIKSLIALCEEKPLDKITVTELTRKAGITRQMFYHYYEDKYELVKTIYVLDHFEIWEKASHTMEMYSWKQIIMMWMQYIKNKKTFYRNTMMSSTDVFTDIMSALVAEMYRNIIRTQEIVLDKELAFQLEVYCIGGMSKLYEWIRSGMQESPEFMVSMFYVSMPTKIQDVLVHAQVPFQEVWKKIKKESPV